MRRLIIAAVALALVSLACVWLLVSPLWIGHFTLRIMLSVPNNVDRTSFRYVECWNDAEAKRICNDNSEYDAGFEPADRTEGRSDFVSVTAGGSTSPFGAFDSYKHPNSLVVEYRSVDGDGATSRHRVPISIPRGRGDRTVTLDLTDGTG